MVEPNVIRGFLRTSFESQVCVAALCDRDGPTVGGDLLIHYFLGRSQLPVYPHSRVFEVCVRTVWVLVKQIKLYSPFNFRYSTLIVEIVAHSKFLQTGLCADISVFQSR